ncbi:kinase-like protein [Daldinia eschscholtzii]|nr:kinase-like protein [Daldinia eschscholtzii]
MDHKSDDDSDGLQCKDLESRPWPERPPQLSVINFRTTQPDQALIDNDNEQHTSPSNVSSSIPTPVRTQFIMSMCRSLDAKSRSFLPQSYIDTITPHLVKGELNKAMPTLSESVLDNYTARVLGVASNNATDQERRSYKLSLESRLVKTFAILVLIGKVETLPSFLASGFADSLLPIVNAHVQHENTWRCFDKWTIPSIEAFIETQWVVLSPFLSAPITDVSLYNFPTQIILPILEDDPATTPPVKFGGYSTVRKIRIHHRHHDFGENQDNPYFALKKLRSQHMEDFQREVAALRPFVVLPHHHIVKLLAAFRHDDSFYLLFPWAEAGSLHTFWKENPRPIPTVSLSRWISEQCLGIATALGQIHHGHDSLVTDSSSYCGRHGDIKPSNILLFQKDTPESNFVWALSDFGLGKLNHHTEKRGDRPVGFSPTYRAPELDLKGEINSAYDIWSLGCVFLELLTWVSCGWEGVQSFALSRVDIDQRSSKVGERDDGFFSITARQGGLSGARLKNGVSLVSLHSHE